MTADSLIWVLLATIWFLTVLWSFCRNNSSLWCTVSYKKNVFCCSFNATLMLEMLRGKRMLFVGDSLNRGQYVSLVCLLHRIIPESSKSMETVDSLTVFKAKVFPLYISVWWMESLEIEWSIAHNVVHLSLSLYLPLFAVHQTIVIAKDIFAKLCTHAAVPFFIAQ